MCLKMGEIYSHFMQQEIVLFMDLGSLQVSESKGLAICLLKGRNNLERQGQDKDKC